jgi:putative nucleotidyltransferase with HDIG domain
MTALNLSPEVVAHAISSLQPLPVVSMELLSSIDDEQSNIDLITQKVSRDQLVVARLLRIANSPFYGLRGRVNSIQDAVVVLGLRQVRMLALAASLSTRFSTAVVPGFSLRDFWRHSMLTGLSAQALALRLHLPQENAFVAGLLHDIGRLVLATCFPKHLTEILAFQHQNQADSLAAEFHILGMNHADIGLILSRQWGFPDTLCEAIANHHAPERCPPKSFAIVVLAANLIAHSLNTEATSSADLFATGKLDPNWLGLPEEEISLIAAGVLQQFLAIQEVLPN